MSQMPPRPGTNSVRAGDAFRALFPGLLRIALLLIGLPSLTAAAPAQYRFDVWDTDAGLPQNTVRAILQTRDGYLWLTTSDGLVRFDGVRFTVFNKANAEGIGSNRFTALYEATDGALWAGTEDGGIVRYAGGAFKTFTTADGLPSNSRSASPPTLSGAARCSSRRPPSTRARARPRPSSP